MREENATLKERVSIVNSLKEEISMLKDRIQFKDEETESVKELLNDSNGKYQSMQQYVSHCKDELHKAQ